MFSLETLHQMNSRARAQEILTEGGFRWGNNNDIPNAWREGKAMRSTNGNFWTDGADIYSYGLRIGTTSAVGSKVAYNFTSTPRRGANGTVIPPHPISQSTGHHQTRVIYHADYVVESAPHYL